MKKNTAILFFSRTATAEALAKRWSPSAKRNLEIANLLFNQTLATIQSTGIPYVQINEAQQIGVNFNERISDALNQFYSLGYQNAIVVGSDCVDLTLKDITSAFQNIELQQNTVGPSKDGGAYLFTISKTQFEALAFKNLSWCTPLLNEELTNYLANSSQNQVLVLENKLDLDFNSKSICSALKNIKSVLSFKLFNLLFHEAGSVSISEPSFYHQEQIDIFRRGPPIFRAA